MIRSTKSKKIPKYIYRQYKNTVSHIKKRWYETKVRESAGAVGAELSVNGPSTVNSNTKLGDNVNFNGIKVYGGGDLEIGDNFHSGPGIKIFTDKHNYESGDAIPYDDTYIQDSVEIEDNVWVGTDVIILSGIHIGEGAIIQAGSTVVDDVASGAIVGGHPAKKFDERDMDRYFSLKKENKFH